jgi:hypothetical protein
MIAIGLLFVGMLCDCSKSRRRLEAEILILRHQLNILRRSAPPRGVRWLDRALFIWLYRRCPRILDAIAIVTMCRGLGCSELGETAKRAATRRQCRQTSRGAYDDRLVRWKAG